MKQDQPDCFKCQHFYTTWDPRFPRGCRAMRFKTREIPAAVVRRNSGRPCLQFTRKESAASSQSPF